MRFDDCRIEWRIADVERKADRACDRLHEMDSIRSDVAGLERADGQIISLVDGLRVALEAALDRIARLEEEVIKIGEVNEP